MEPALETLPHGERAAHRAEAILEALLAEPMMLAVARDHPAAESARANVARRVRLVLFDGRRYAVGYGLAPAGATALSAEARNEDLSVIVIESSDPEDASLRHTTKIAPVFERAATLDRLPRGRAGAPRPRDRAAVRSGSTTLRRRFADLDRLATGLAALAIAVALAVALAFVSSNVNRPPVITAVQAGPQPVASGGTATIEVSAQDPDGEPFRIDYKAEVGRVVALAGPVHKARYSGPAREANGPRADRITVTATDARGNAHEHVARHRARDRPRDACAHAGADAGSDGGAHPAASAHADSQAPAHGAASDRRPAHGPAAALARTNRPPILQEGTTVSDLGDAPIVLVATGNEPDGEPITHSWDFGPCVESKNVTQFEAEVKLVGQCSYAVVTLTWSDPEGATATAQWQLSR